jgi:hypothetical protein
VLNVQQAKSETIEIPPGELLYPEWIVLRTVAIAENGIHVSALVQELSDEMSKVTVIRALAKLEHRQLVRASWVRSAGWKRMYFVANGRVARLVNNKLEPLFVTSRRSKQTTKR